MERDLLPLRGALLIVFFPIDHFEGERGRVIPPRIIVIQKNI